MEAASETEVGAAQVEKAPSSKGPTAPAAADANAEHVGEAERNPIFDALVTPNDDIAGLVAYSLYKQNKRAWLDDFIKATGRAPSDAESRAYIIGESTERRLNAYRRLAAETLAGQGPRPPTANGAARKAIPIAGALVWALVVVLALAVLGLALHAGYLTPPK
ncbi:MAG: hypothetical protein ABR878_18000 [Roseiarcus sp.]|jgi:hypothetical protein